MNAILEILTDVVRIVTAQPTRSHAPRAGNPRQSENPPSRNCREPRGGETFSG